MRRDLIGLSALGLGFWLLAAVFLLATGQPAWSQEPVAVAAPKALSPEEGSHPADHFVSHRGLYRMALTHADESTQIDDLTGLLGLEWENSCEGFTFTEWMLSYFWDFEGREFLSDTRSTTWESRDRKDYGFRVTDRTNGEITKKLSGNAKYARQAQRNRLAHRDQEPGAGRIEFSEGEEADVDLPAGVVFPTLHLALIDEAARGGTSVLALPVFDALGEARVYTSVAHILPYGPSTAVDGAPSLLAGIPSTTVLVSYFDPASAEELPEYEVSFRLYANGIVDALTATYNGELGVRADLIELDMMTPVAACGPR